MTGRLMIEVIANLYWPGIRPAAADDQPRTART